MRNPIWAARMFWGAVFIMLMAMRPQSAWAATLTVTNGGDSGAGTLRQAIAAATTGDTINFAAGVTDVTLTSGQLNINKNLTISGPGASTLVVQRSTTGGTANFRVFSITDGQTVTISGLTVFNGATTGANMGGGILNAGTLTISNCVIRNNQSSLDGGGISSSGALTLNNSAITDNTAVGFGGGLNFTGPTLNATNCRFADNSSSSGAGVLTFGTGTATFTGCTLSGNQATFDGGEGGGISSGTDVQATFRNCTISGNSADYGGGLACGAVDLDSCTIVNNTADIQGGGVYNGGTLIAENSIIGGNSAPDAPDCQGTITSEGYNLIESTSGATIVGTTTGNITGQDPALGPLADNGGPTQTHEPLSGSPVINSGSTALTTDQRGVSRPQGRADDIGAVELQDVTPPTVTVSTPTANQTVTSLSSITGTANDNFGVSSVYVFLFRKGGREFWDSQSWVTYQAALPATLSTPGGTNTNWTRNTNLPTGANLTAGNYGIIALAYDANGNAGVSAYRYFKVGSDTTAPAMTITTPSANANVSTLPSISGSATDSGGSGVSSVFIYLFRNGGTQYWNGTAWVNSQVALQANVANVGSNSTTWSRTANLPTGTALTPGSYGIVGLVYDGVGNQGISAYRYFNVTGSPTIASKSSITLKSGSVSASLSQVRLRFDGALDAKTAGDVSRYSVEVNGAYVEIASVRYEASTQSVVLQLRDGSLQAGDDVIVSWNNLVDASGRTFSGHTDILTAR